MCDFVSNRTQCIRYNQAISEYKVFSGALPQGTKLGPIGFQVIINDDARDLGDKVECWKYVDDLTLAESRWFPQPSGMQVVLDELNEWTNKNKLSLNPSKCQALQVCFKTNTPPHAELSIAGGPLSFVPEAKILGVWFQNDLQWDKNINEISKKVNQKYCTFSSCSRGLDSMITSSCLFANAMLDPLYIECADAAWSSFIIAAQENFETPAKTRVQNHFRTARLHYICGCFGDLWT